MKPGTFVQRAEEWVRTGEMKIPPRHLPKRFHQMDVELHGQSARTNSTSNQANTYGVPTFWLM
jgi:hypothetical protein